MRSRRSPIAFKSTVLWRGEGRSLFGGAIRSEDMETMIGNGGQLEGQGRQKRVSSEPEGRE